VIGSVAGPRIFCRFVSGRLSTHGFCRAPNVTPRTKENGDACAVDPTPIGARGPRGSAGAGQTRCCMRARRCAPPTTDVVGRFYQQSRFLALREGWDKGPRETPAWCWAPAAPARGGGFWAAGSEARHQTRCISEPGRMKTRAKRGIPNQFGAERRASRGMGPAHQGQ